MLALLGWEAIADSLLKAYPKLGKGLQLVFLLYVLIFPFTNNIYALHPQRDLALTPQQQQAKIFVKIIKQQHLAQGEPLPRIVSRDPYLSLLLEIDHLEYEEHLSLSEKHLKELRAGDWILWDSWFAVVEEGIKEQQLDARGDLEQGYRQDTIINNAPIIYKLYERK